MVAFLGILLFIAGLISFFLGCWSDGFETAKEANVRSFLTILGILFLTLSCGIGLAEIVAEVF